MINSIRFRLYLNKIRSDQLCCNLQHPIQEALKKGITAISLEATEMGRPLYEKHGFVRMKDEMEYSNKKYDLHCGFPV